MSTDTKAFTKLFCSITISTGVGGYVHSFSAAMIALGVSLLYVVVESEKA